LLICKHSRLISNKLKHLVILVINNDFFSVLLQYMSGLKKWKYNINNDSDYTSKIYTLKTYILLLIQW